MDESTSGQKEVTPEKSEEKKKDALTPAASQSMETPPVQGKSNVVCMVIAISAIAGPFLYRRSRVLHRR